MTDKEKLLEVLIEAMKISHRKCEDNGFCNCPNYGMDSDVCNLPFAVDHLIAAGVTFATDNNVGSKMENEKCSHNWEAECMDLRMKCRELDNHNKCLTDENSKIGLMYEQLLKEKSDLERKVGLLEGQIEAYQYCINVRRL